MAWKKKKKDRQRDRCNRPTRNRPEKLDRVVIIRLPVWTH